MNSCKRDSWVQLDDSRRAIARRWPRVQALSLAHSARQLVLQRVTRAMRVLEIGASRAKWRDAITSAHNGVTYHTLDIDLEVPADFRDLTEIETPYNLIFAMEVIEHLSIDEIPAWLQALRESLAPEGILILSTPNTFSPSTYLRDATHRTPLCYDELGGLALRAGFEVLVIHRVFRDVWWRYALKRFALGWLFPLLGLDYARQIVLTAKRA